MHQNARPKKLQRLLTMACPRHTPAVAWCAVRHIGGGVHRAVGKAKQQPHWLLNQQVHTVGSTTTQGLMRHQKVLHTVSGTTTKAPVPRHHPPSGQNPHFTLSKLCRNAPHTFTRHFMAAAGSPCNSVCPANNPEAHTKTCRHQPRQGLQVMWVFAGFQTSASQNKSAPHRASVLHRPPVAATMGQKGWVGRSYLHQHIAASTHSPHMKCHMKQLAPPGRPAAAGAGGALAPFGGWAGCRLPGRTTLPAWWRGSFAPGTTTSWHCSSSPTTAAPTASVAVAAGSGSQLGGWSLPRPQCPACSRTYSKAPSNAAMPSGAYRTRTTAILLAASF